MTSEPWSPEEARRAVRKAMLGLAFSVLAAGGVWILLDRVVPLTPVTDSRAHVGVLIALAVLGVFALAVVACLRWMPFVAFALGGVWVAFGFLTAGETCAGFVIGGWGGAASLLGGACVLLLGIALAWRELVAQLRAQFPAAEPTVRS